MGTYRRLFNTLINGAREGIVNNLDKLLDAIEEKGNDVLNSLDGKSVEEIYEELFGGQDRHEDTTFKDWFKEKEEAYKRRRESRKSGRRNKSSYRKTSSSPSTYTSSDPYKVFGLSRNAEWKEIRTAYIRLVKKLHPDSRDKNMKPSDAKKADIHLQQVYTAWEYFEKNRSKYK